MSRSRPLARQAKPRQSGVYRLPARFWYGALWVIAGAAVAYGLVRIEPRSREIARAIPRLEWVNLPSWLATDQGPWREILRELEASLDESGPALGDWDLFDSRVCPYVASQLQASPWIEVVERVSKGRDGAIRVAARFRQPFAIVERDQAAYFVDEHGVRLPNTRDLDRLDWLVIQGVLSPAPEPGELWDGQDLVAGLKLARFLYAAEASSQLAFRRSIRSIDVTNFQRRSNAWAGELQLVTINPSSYIHWGLPPGEEFGIEASAEVKLGVLNRLYQDGSRLPGGPWIDVRSGEWVDYPKTPDEPAEVG